MRDNTNKFISAILLLLSGFAVSINANAFSLFSKGSYADPPSRVARLSYTQGEISFSPSAAKQTVWVTGRINRPIVTGDRIWADTHARAELQLGNATIRINDQTSVRVINLNDQLAQIDLSQGTLILHVRSIKAGQSYEIDTPQLAFSVSQAGDYRVEVANNGTSTIVSVRKGNGIAYSKNAAYKINSNNTYRFSGKNLQTQRVTVTKPDSFDKWSLQRDTRSTRSRSVNYVSNNMIGYEDLDNYGSWRYVASYGYVWTPSHVPSGWAPYRYGHWSWINPWGWTWVDDQPWGFAPSHYGRWAHYRNTWVWIPGPRTVEPTYAPALVVFIGGGKQRIEVNSDPAVAWFPLGPNDVYVPPYTVSKTYFNNVNVSNTTINQVQITNVYSHQTTQTNYTNYSISNSITAVSTKSFLRSESTAKSAIAVPVTVVNQAPVTTTLNLSPSQQSSTGTVVTTSKPSNSTLERPPVVVTAPPSSSTPVVQVSPPATVTAPPASTGYQVNDGASVVTGTYNGGDTATSTVVTAPSKTDADAKADAEKAAAEKEAATAKENAEKQAAEQAEAEKAKAEAEKKASEAAKQATAEKEATANAEAEKAADKQAEAEKKQAAEADHAAANQAAAANAEAEKQAAEQREAEKAQAAKAEADRATAEQAAAAKAEAQQQAAEQREAEKAAAKAEADRAAAEQAAAAKAEAQRQAAEQAAAAKAEAERQAAEQAAAAKAEAERHAAEQAAAAKAEAERAAAAQAAQAPAPSADPAPAS